MDANNTSIEPTPGSVSPTMDPPSLLNSTSLSSESTSPPLPSTPPGPIRGRSRYGELAPKGHVPLHRRGTSNKYENFEDLLREAGYSETRIFTPEHPKADGTESMKGSIRGGVGAVVDFLAHFVPSTTTSRSSSQAPRITVDNSAPLTSPLPPTMVNHSTQSTSDLSTISSTSITSEPTPKPAESRRRVHNMIKAHSTPQAAPPHSPDGYPAPHYFAHGARRPHHTSRYGINSPERVDSAPQYPKRDPHLGNRPGPSHASAYLRHISSVPSMRRVQHHPTPRRVRPMYVSTVDVDMDGIQGRGNGEGEVDLPPPLPKGWLTSVTQAMLQGATAGPSRLRNSSSFRSRSARPPSPPPIEPSTSRSGLSDQTHLTVPSANRGRPNLLARVSSTKSKRSESAVSRTRVTCRSTPVSRNGSRVRSSSSSRKKKSRKGKKGQNDQERFRGRKPRRNEDFMPSLSRTKVEGDEWLRRGKVEMSAMLRGERGDEEFVFSDSPSGTSTEEEDGELDLARILVAPRRHNSIRSLKRHLPLANSAPNATTALLSLSRASSFRQFNGSSLKRTTPPQDGSDDESDWPPRRSDKRYSRDIEEYEGHEEQQDYFSFASTSRQSTKRKSIPQAWSQGYIASEEVI